MRKERAATGHLPIWLATNHFMGEGFWFWVIPLQGKTSLGLVYDNTIFPRERVATPQKLIEWVCQEFPLFARDLPSGRFSTTARSRISPTAVYRPSTHRGGRSRVRRDGSPTRSIAPAVTLLAFITH